MSDSGIVRSIILQSPLAQIRSENWTCGLVDIVAVLLNFTASLMMSGKCISYCISTSYSKEKQLLSCSVQRINPNP